MGRSPWDAGMGDLRKKNILETDFEGKKNPSRKYPAVMALYVSEKILSPKVW